ncbi:Uncharacterised protein [Mycobacterium tuberculosis]|nr:Uncharacterised protein [Mycobacterium tuberculosis]
MGHQLDLGHTQAVQNRSQIVSHLGLGIPRAGRRTPARAAQVGTQHPVAVGGQRADEVAPLPPVLREAVHQHYRRTIGRPGVRNVDPDAFRHIHVPMFDTFQGGQSDHCLTSLCQNRIPVDSACTGRVAHTIGWQTTAAGADPRDPGKLSLTICAPLLHLGSYLSAPAVRDCRDCESGDATRRCGVARFTVAQ